MLRSPAIDIWFSLFTGHAGEVADLPRTASVLSSSRVCHLVWSARGSGRDGVARSASLGHDMDVENVFCIGELCVRASVLHLLVVC